QGKYFSMPVRNVVPKPAQRPHPPIWVACSNRDTIHLAAQLGIGALTFAFVDPAEAKKWVDDYYETFKNECVPIGHTVNPNVAMVTSFSCHPDAQVAFERGFDGFKFFQFGLGHHYVFGSHKPGRTDIWKQYEAVKAAMGPEQLDFLGGGTDGIGTPAQLREHLSKFANAGVDQTVFIQQGGKNKHEHICESLELFAAEVMPEFKAEEEERQAKKMDELAPSIAKAFERKQWMKELADDEIEEYPAYGAMIAEVDVSQLDEVARARAERWAKMRAVLAKMK
ncbi:MAG: LLM class flavin-dependent oxidoreductase, partial [Microbacteriaceae bacterium]|nr:LLM class flavin-dependent oxidoreductase [Microbacteriaceae bacterium]